MKCEIDHFKDEDDCIECNHEDTGGNWKRWVICLFRRHDWYYTYSWIGHCNRCSRERLRKGTTFEPLGDGYSVG